MKIGAVINGASPNAMLADLIAAAKGYGRATINVCDHEKVLKALDVDAFVQVLTEIGNGTAPVSRHATLAMMHKIRAQWSFRRSFTDGERRISKRWLVQHGYTTRLNDDKLQEVQAG